MGGQIVMEFYRLFPERVRALVLADTYCQAETENGRKLRHDQAKRLLREGIRGYAEEVLPKMVAPYNIEALPAVADHVLAVMLQTPPDYTDLLARVSVPALVVVGRDDEFTPVAGAEFMTQRIPQAMLAIIEGAAHMPNLDSNQNSTTRCGSSCEPNDIG